MSQANCLLTAGYTLGCLDNSGGIKKLYLANWDSDVEYTESSSVITAITSGNTYYSFDVVRETAGVNETITTSIENGTVFYEQNLSVVFNKMTTTLRDQILLLAKATTTAIVEDLNGTYWLLGEVSGLNLSEGTSGTGVALADRNGYAITLQGREPESMKEIQYAAFSGLIS